MSAEGIARLSHLAMALGNFCMGTIERSIDCCGTGSGSLRWRNDTVDHQQSLERERAVLCTRATTSCTAAQQFHLRPALKVPASPPKGDQASDPSWLCTRDLPPSHPPPRPESARGPLLPPPSVSQAHSRTLSSPSSQPSSPS
jgi:hypothetical protein